MKRLSILIIVIASACLGQNVQVVKIEQLLSNDKQAFAYPKFSPNGEKILLSSPKYKGLWIYDLKKYKLQKLNNKKGAGYRAFFSDNGDKIIFRYNDYRKGRKYSTLAIQNLVNPKIQTIIKKRRHLSAPHYLGGSQVLLNLQTKQQVYDLDSKGSAPVAALGKSVASETVAYTENSRLTLLQEGQQKKLAPLGPGHYIWGSISPDKSRILFTMVGKGTYIANLAGEIITELGHLNYPSWSPTGEWILGMRDQDDGHRYTASEIVVIAANGSEQYELTQTSDKIELHPAWSPAGNQIIYDTVEGNIELIEIKIN